MENKMENINNQKNRMPLGAEKADGAVATVGQTITHLADSVRRTAGSDSTVGTAVSTVADGLEASGEYLKNHGITEMKKDVTDLISKHPVHSLWIGVGLGALLGMTIARR
jgi:hypothetical protein